MSVHFPVKFVQQEASLQIQHLIQVTIPDKLNTEERRLVEALAEQPDFKRASKVENQNIFERMKNFFR